MFKQHKQINLVLFKTFKTCISLGMLVSLFSCQSKHNSNLQVANGVITDDYLAVVKLEISESQNNGTVVTQMCTGTFISDSLLITAAHCIADDNGAQIINATIKAVLPNGRKAVASRAYMNKNFHPYVLKYGHSSTYDHALIKFPKNTSSNFLNISKTQILRGDTATIVGFGISDFIYEYDAKYKNFNAVEGSNSNSGEKQKGEVKFNGNDEVRNYFGHLECLENSGCIVTEGTSKQETNYVNRRGIDSSLGEGDSGGPFIVEGKGIVGIASARIVKDSSTYRHFSLHTDLHSQASKDFFKEASANGFTVEYNANIPETNNNSINNNDSSDLSTDDELNSLDISTDENRNEDTENNILNNSEPIITTDFSVKPISEGQGIFSFEFNNIPANGATIELYWNSDYSFESLSVEARTSFKTDVAYGLRFLDKMKMNVLNANGEVIATHSLILPQQ